MNATDRERLRHDVASACAQHSFDFLCGLLPEGGEREVFAGLYARVLAALEVYDLQTDRRRRLAPGNN